MCQQGWPRRVGPSSSLVTFRGCYQTRTCVSSTEKAAATTSSAALRSLRASRLRACQRLTWCPAVSTRSPQLIRMHRATAPASRLRRRSVRWIHRAPRRARPTSTTPFERWARTSKASSRLTAMTNSRTHTHLSRTSLPCLPRSPWGRQSSRRLSSKSRTRPPPSWKTALMNRLVAIINFVNFYNWRLCRYLYS